MVEIGYGLLEVVRLRMGDRGFQLGSLWKVKSAGGVSRSDWWWGQRPVVCWPSDGGNVRDVGTDSGRGIGRCGGAVIGLRV